MSKSGGRNNSQVSQVNHKHKEAFPPDMKLKDMKAKVYEMSKDQQGCRQLQEELGRCDVLEDCLKCEEENVATAAAAAKTDDDKESGEDGNTSKGGKQGNAAGVKEDASGNTVGVCNNLCFIFEESMPHLRKMMVDPFGNYLFQKLMEKANASHREQIVKEVCKNPDKSEPSPANQEEEISLAEAALNLHGTRSVQKLVEATAKSEEEATLVASALDASTVILSIDANGNHVIQKALQCWQWPQTDFIFNAVINNCVQVATHRHGCCVLQRCIDAADEEKRAELISKVSEHALRLIQDPFGMSRMRAFYVLPLSPYKSRDH
jgi:hypothetical protein